MVSFSLQLFSYNVIHKALLANGLVATHCTRISPWPVLNNTGCSQTGWEATLKQPRKLIFQSWNQIFGQVTRQWALGMAHCHNPKESTYSARYCKVTILFGEILIFTSTVLGGFFANFKPLLHSCVNMIFSQNSCSFLPVQRRQTST